MDHQAIRSIFVDCDVCRVNLGKGCRIGGFKSGGFRNLGFVKLGFYRVPVYDRWRGVMVVSQRW